MADKIKGFTVTLEKDIHQDSVELMVQAISMIKGVAHVTPSIVTGDDYFNRQMIKYEMRDKFYKFLTEELMENKKQ